MKVIENNYTETLKTYRITCDSCKSVFECTEDDFCSDYFDQCEMVYCPLCGKSNYIEE